MIVKYAAFIDWSHVILSQLDVACTGLRFIGIVI
jgi:hypothetical protein